jgi:hypothetical protein
VAWTIAATGDVVEWKFILLELVLLLLLVDVVAVVVVVVVVVIVSRR